MNEEWKLDPDDPDDAVLIENLLAARQTSQGADAPCSYHPNRESLIWAYADGFLSEEEGSVFWQEISQCRLCLGRLAAVQQALQAAETWTASSLSVEVQPGAIPLRSRILSLFHVQWLEESMNRVGQALASSTLELVPALGEETKRWRGTLAGEWSQGQAKVAVEIGLSGQNRPLGIKARITLTSPAGHPLTNVKIDFCDVSGAVMETGMTDAEGRITFSSREAQRFIREDKSPPEIGFCLELGQGQEMTTWQLVLDSEASA